MSTKYPAALDTFSNPQADDRMDVVDHAGQHASLNDAVLAMQKFVGTTTQPGPALANATGTPGPAGPQGPAGVAGANGTNGSDGAPGAAGANGITPNVQAGTTTTTAPGTNATVTRRAGSPDAAPVLDFGIPQGAAGAPGAQGVAGTNGTNGTTPNVTAGTTTTTAAGTNATVTRRAGSTDAAPILDFGIPRGADGAPGAAGATGPQGTAAPVGTATPQPLGTASAGTTAAGSPVSAVDHVHDHGDQSARTGLTHHAIGQISGFSASGSTVATGTPAQGRSALGSGTFGDLQFQTATNTAAKANLAITAADVSGAVDTSSAQTIGGNKTLTGATATAGVTNTGTLTNVGTAALYAASGQGTAIQPLQVQPPGGGTAVFAVNGAGGVSAASANLTTALTVPTANITNGIVSGFLRLATRTVATLPAASTVGDHYYVSNVLTPQFNTTAATWSYPASGGGIGGDVFCRVANQFHLVAAPNVQAAA